MVGCWTCSACTIDFFPALAALVSPVQNIIFLIHFFTLSVPFAEQPGQAGLLGRLSLCLCSQPKVFNSIAQFFLLFAHKQILTKFSFYSNLTKYCQGLKKNYEIFLYVLYVFLYSLFLEGLCGGGESGPWVPCLEHAAGLRFTRALG